MYPESLMQRFWSKVARCAHPGNCEACCWLWQAGHSRGYGTFGIPKAWRMGRSTTERANRVAWQSVHGPLLPGLHVLHRCDNPRCVNPAHLWVGTIGDNQRDSMHKGRRPRGDQHGFHLHPEAVARGEANSQAKLTEAQVRAIWALKGQHSHPHIAAMFGVSPATIQLIHARKTWTHVDLPDDLGGE